MREYDTLRKQRYLKIKEKNSQESGKAKINK
jgi:hypothetical protein